MKSLKVFCLVLLCGLMAVPLRAQTTDYEAKIRALNLKKEKIKEQEKAALKAEIEGVEKRLSKGEISPAEAQSAKEEFARKRALNIENRIAIVDNQIALLERNKGEDLKLQRSDTAAYTQIRIGWGNGDDEEEDQFFGFETIGLISSIFLNTNYYECLPCSSPCVTCSVDSTTCTSCVAGYSLSGTNCLTTC